MLEQNGYSLGHTRHADLIRLAAAAVADSGQVDRAILKALRWVERAGMLSEYALTATAQKYLTVHDTERMAAMLAARIGDPLVPPVPPLWPLLAMLLLGWPERLSAAGVIGRAEEAGAEAERGLAIVAHLFPELRLWLEQTSLTIPAWERTLAVPIAARKLAAVGRMD